MPILFRLLAVFPLLCLVTTSRAAEPQRLRVLSYNIHHAEGVDGKLDVQRIANVILSAKPDLVALQEVDNNATRTGSVDQPAELARMTGMQVAFGANIELQGGHYGNAVLSRFPIAGHRNHLLPNLDNGEQRGVLIADIELPGQPQPLRFLATHLDHRRSAAERIASAEAINALATEHPETATLLAGDLNDTPDSETLRTFGQQWASVNQQPLPTIPVGEPSRQIDFILHRPSERWNVIDTQVLEEAVASDHRAIFAELELLPVETAKRQSEIRDAAEKALSLLNEAAAGSARHRECFTCHSQALPVFAMHEARRRGIRIDEENFARQIEHTHAHLERGRENYKAGKGQGGGVDTAGYALWTLEDGDVKPDDTTAAVIQWLLTKQQDDGRWKTTSNRPPSESSDFTATYLALRALTVFGNDAQRDDVDAAIESVAAWLKNAEPSDTEERVFQLLALTYVDDEGTDTAAAAAELAKSQHESGGWSQLPSMTPDAYATGTALYALREAGLKTSDAVWQRGLNFLLSTQLEDGSWYVKSRSNPFQTYFETGFPHGTDQFISTTATGWATLALLNSLPEATAEPYETLPGTKPIEWPEEDLSGRLMDGAHRFVESQIEKTNRERRSRESVASPDELRTRLNTILGVVEKRHPPRMERFGTTDDPAVVAETARYRITQVRWPVLGRIVGEGLLIEQKGDSVGNVIVIPDADQTPEELCGLLPVDGAKRPTALPFADNGFNVLIPSIVSRGKLPTNDDRLQRADFTDREWIYRQAFHMGRHVIGYDIQRILASVDWLESLRTETSPKSIGIAGYGEGGLIALHAAAIDPRIDAALVSGYFTSSDFWSEPIYRNVWSRLKDFGNAEVAALVAPRKLVIEFSEFPTVTRHKGDVANPTFSDVKAEFDRIPGDHATLVSGDDNSPTQPFSNDAREKFFGALGVETLAADSSEPVPATDADAARSRANDRRQRTWQELEDHVQTLVRASEHVRDDFFPYTAMPELREGRWTTEKTHATCDADEFIAAAKPFRETFHKGAMGQFHAELLPPNARTRKVAETDSWTAYDVVVDVHDDLFAWGVLVVPKDLQPGEKRPVVVCQHGRNGVPRDTIDGDNSAYNNFAAELAERGFITFAPHNLYRGEDRYRWLDRKANTIGCSLFSFIISQHDQILNWLDSLPFVDGNRIAFYGLSYGGETAVRVPTILEKYCLSICSGDFNQWTRKVAATDQPFSFMNTIEWEMPYWSLGHTFDYAEMTYLMFPRPFMVERGHHDRVGRDQWVAHEFAKVRWLYAQFGMADRVSIEYFQGGHSINGAGTFEFLHKHLNWPKR